MYGQPATLALDPQHGQAVYASGVPMHPCTHEPYPNVAFRLLGNNKQTDILGQLFWQLTNGLPYQQAPWMTTHDNSTRWQPIRQPFDYHPSDHTSEIWPFSLQQCGVSFKWFYTHTQKMKMTAPCWLYTLIISSWSVYLSGIHHQKKTNLNLPLKSTYRSH